MNPFAALGLSADADEAQIKRAYARLLRANRPDDDPAGFQRLNEAYQQCLEWARRRVAAEVAMATDAFEDEDDAEDDDALAQGMRMPPAPRPAPIPLAPAGGSTAPTPPAAPLPSAPPAPRAPFVAPPAPAQPSPPSAPAAASVPVAPSAPAAPVPVPPPAPAAPKPPSASAGAAAQAAPANIAEAPEAEFDARHFLDELYRHAETGSVAGLERWLVKHPALYQLERKHALAPALIAHLSARAPLYLPQLDALLRFFDLDTVHAHSAGLQARIVELRARARRSGADLSGVQFGSARGRSQPGLFPERGLRLRTVVLVMLSLGVIGAMLQYLMGPGQP
ncbi:J domain-containing protein [Lysobacter enzymogenes]|uniref:J domain-containing protein n=1 Tax=Lysobacter enzymogenes TaxID=69 RepID=UPI001A95CB21|nr:J domain-containing protein [Lysobacter enzymogenes]QQP96706.1 J domain-containing protein [Lysobacter enzymogenes]